jgi:UDP-glucose 4-epimerase
MPKGYEDEFCIGSLKSFSIHEIAKMFGGRIIFLLPERKGNRMTVDMVTEKTQLFGWNAQQLVIEYIEEQRIMSWGNGR